MEHDSTGAALEPAVMDVAAAELAELAGWLAGHRTIDLRELEGELTRRGVTVQAGSAGA